MRQLVRPRSPTDDRLTTTKPLVKAIWGTARRLGVQHIPNAAMYIAGLEVLRVTRDECLSSSRQDTDVWVDKTAPNNGLTTLDPILAEG